MIRKKLTGSSPRPFIFKNLNSSCTEGGLSRVWALGVEIETPVTVKVGISWLLAPALPAEPQLQNRVSALVTEEGSEPPGHESPHIFSLNPASEWWRASEGEKRFYRSTTGCAAGVSIKVLVIINMGPSLIIKVCLKETGSTWVNQGKITFANKLANLVRRTLRTTRDDDQQSKENMVELDGKQWVKGGMNRRDLIIKKNRSESGPVLMHTHK